MNLINKEDGFFAGCYQVAFRCGDDVTHVLDAGRNRGELSKAASRGTSNQVAKCRLTGTRRSPQDDRGNRCLTGIWGQQTPQRRAVS